MLGAVKKLGGVALTAAVMIVLAACAPAPQEADAPAPARTPEPLPAKCLTATEGAIVDLQGDVAATVDVAEFTGAGVTKSDSGDDVWFIALQWKGDGITYTGTWATMQDPTANDQIAYVAADDVAALSGTYQQPAAFEGFTSTLIGADDCIR